MNTIMEKENIKSAVMLTGGRGDIGDKDKSKRKKLFRSTNIGLILHQI